VIDCVGVLTVREAGPDSDISGIVII
jgi:hypothetical protein